MSTRALNSIEGTSVTAGGHCRGALLAGVLAGLFCTAGCQPKSAGEPKTPTYPVHGRLLIDGAPATGAMVKFYSSHQGGRVPTAIVRDDGSFSVSFYDNEDGAPAGEYKLLVVWMQTPPQGGLAQDRLGGRFLNPARPVATVTVVAGPNQLAPLELTTKNTEGPGRSR
jgi:hypothetical protein